MLDRERIARRKFELSQKINDNAKLLGGLVHYLSYLVAGEWVAFKPPRREGSRKLTLDYLRHLTAARRVLRLRARKRFSPDGGNYCEYYLSPVYESHLLTTIGLDLYDRFINVDFDALPTNFKLRDLQEFSDSHPDLLERAKTFLAEDYLRLEARRRPFRQPVPPVSLASIGHVAQTTSEQHKREAWLHRSFPGLEL